VSWQRSEREEGLLTQPSHPLPSLLTDYTIFCCTEELGTEGRCCVFGGLYKRENEVERGSMILSFSYRQLQTSVKRESVYVGA